MPSGVYVFAISMGFWFIVVDLLFKMARDVNKTFPPKAQRPWTNLIEALDWGRVWKLDKKMHGRSKRRRCIVIFGVIGGLGMILGFTLLFHE